MKKILVFGTDTNVGKTLFCTNLYNHLVKSNIPTRIIKPVVSGISEKDNDLDHYSKLQNIDKNNISLYSFNDPVSADIAANREGKKIKFKGIVDFIKKPEDAEYLIIETVGGTMSPITESKTCIDLAKEIKSYNILVSGVELGCINKVLLSLYAAKSNKVPIRCILLNNYSRLDTEYIEEIIFSICKHFGKKLVFINTILENDRNNNQKSLEWTETLMGMIDEKKSC